MDHIQESLYDYSEKQKTWKIEIEFREVADENGTVPINSPIEYSINMEQAKGLDCQAVISAALTMMETMVNHINKTKNEQNSVQLEESQTEPANA